MYSVLVTGANGFLGRHFVSSLMKLKADINVLVRNYDRVIPEWGEKVKIFTGDINDNKLLENACRGVEIVLHLASYVHQKPRTEEEIKYIYEVNVKGTKNILSSLSTSVQHIIFISTVSVYGREIGESIDEKVQAEPSTPYGHTKLEAEEVIRGWGKKKQVMTTSLRLPLVYGPGNKGNIYKMIRAIDKGYFVMIGTGENKRSMVNARNVVDAALEIVNNKDADGKIYLVTDGVDYSVIELYKTIAKELGRRISPFYIPMSVAKKIAWFGDIAGGILRKPVPFNSEVLEKLTGTLTFSFDKIRKEIGFQPKYNLYNTIPETIRWYKSVGS